MYLIGPSWDFFICFHFFSISGVFLLSSSLILTLSTSHCLQWRNARFCNVFFDVTSCYRKSLCKIPSALFRWNIFHSLRYEHNCLTNRIAGKQRNIKKIELYHVHTKSKGKQLWNKTKFKLIRKRKNKLTNGHGGMIIFNFELPSLEESEMSTYRLFELFEFLLYSRFTSSGFDLVLDKWTLYWITPWQWLWLKA